MKTIRLLLFGLLISGLLPAAAFAQRDYDFKIGHDFSRLKTYAFEVDEPDAKPVGTTGTATYDSPLITDRTNAAVAAELERRGLRRDDQNPDVYVKTQRAFRKEQVVYSDYPWGWGYPFAYGWGYGYGWSTYTSEIVVGSLTVDLRDAGSGGLVWRGTSEKRVHQTSSPERRTKRIKREVDKIFDDFPPALASRQR